MYHPQYGQLEYRTPYYSEYFISAVTGRVTQSITYGNRWVLLDQMPPTTKDSSMHIHSAYIGKATIAYELKPSCKDWEPIAFRVPKSPEHYVGANGEIVQYNPASPCVNPRLIMKKIIVWRRPTIDDFAPSKLPREAAHKGVLPPVRIMGFRLDKISKLCMLITDEGCTISNWEDYYIHD